MKKRVFAVLVGLMLFVGCAGFQLPSADQAAVQIVAQRIGYYVAKNNPSIVPQAKLIALGVTSSQDPELMKVALNLAVKELTKQFPTDPLLAADLNIIISSVKLNQPGIKLNLEQVTPIINAFINGMDVAVK